MNITTSGLAFIMAVVIPRLDDLSAEKKIKNIFTRLFLTKNGLIRLGLISIK